jgi:CubicO group peptidase (beta-lactamase class C family)
MSERLEGAKEGRAWVASVASPVSVTGGRRDAEDRAAARVAPRADGTWPPPIDEATLVALLSKHAVAGVSMAMITPGEGGHGADGSRVVAQCAGMAVTAPSIASALAAVVDVAAAAGTRGDAPLAPQPPPPSKVTDSTWFQIASLSKTIATAFALQYFEAKGVPLSTPVNALLAKHCPLGSPSHFALRSAEGTPAQWAEDVALLHLFNYTGLGLHYVNGVPLAHAMPPVVALVSGSAAAPAPYRYATLDVVKAPGTAFGYSGGGFLVLQLLLEAMEERPIAAIMAPFLARSGSAVSLGLSFFQRLPAKHYAFGYRSDGAMVAGGRLMFPPLAAGGLGSAAAVAEWLKQLALAYVRPEGCGAIAHRTARAMLTPGDDLGSEAFMAARMGLGCFVFEAEGGSKWMLHQAANDGYRGVYLVCFDGPDAAEGPRGVVIFSNGDNNAMFFNCDVLRHLLRSGNAFAPPLRGLDWSRVAAMDGGFESRLEDLKQEEIVNIGLKELVLNAFKR